MSAFSNPHEAVAAIAQLLQAEDWAALTGYYDLDGSGVDSNELESGRFFIRRDPPPVAHPAGFWKYRHPFPPGFRYESHEITGDVAIVQVGISIDQGDGMVQRGTKTFRMKKKDQGWQILPT